MKNKNLIFIREIFYFSLDKGEVVLVSTIVYKTLQGKILIKLRKTPLEKYLL